MDVNTIMQAIQTGLSGALLIVLNKLWQAYEQQNEKIFGLVENAQIERAILAKELGYDTQKMGEIVRQVKDHQRRKKAASPRQEETD